MRNGRLRYPFHVRHACALIILLACIPARSQVLVALILGDDLNSGKIEFGLTTGLNASTIDGVEGGQPELAPYLGLYFDIKLSEKWYFHPETWPKTVLGQDKLPSYATGDSALDVQLADATVRRKFDVIPTSFMITRKFGEHIYVDAGPYATLIMGARDIFTRETGDDELTYTVKITEAMHKIELGGGLGVRYKISKGLGVNLGVYGYMGLTSPDKADQWKFQWLRASVGIPIGRGKVKKAEVTEP
jgi:hypothetical protein